MTIRARIPLTFLLLALLAAPAAAKDPNAKYRLHSRFWLAYPADLHALGLFHLDRTAAASEEDLLHEDSLTLDPAAESAADALLMDQDEVGAGGELEGVPARDGSLQKRDGMLVGGFEWVDAARFGGGVRLQRDGALVAGPYRPLRGGKAFTIECWFRPEAETDGAVMVVAGPAPAQPAFRVERTAAGALRFLCGEEQAILLEEAAPTGRWTHLALLASPPRSVPTEYPFVSKDLGAQMIVRLNGEVAEIWEDPLVGRQLGRAVGGVRFGAPESGGDSFLGLLDEARVSDELRVYYDRKVEWTDPAGERAVPVGAPYLRRAEDQIFHAPLDRTLQAGATEPQVDGQGTIRYFDGVHGKALLTGGTLPSPTWPAGAVRREAGSVEFWFSPYDWDNRRLQGFHDPMELVPLVHVVPEKDPEKRSFLIISVLHKQKRNKKPPPLIAPGKWYHVVATWDGQKKKVYLNAKPVPEATISFSLSPERSPTAVSLNPNAVRQRYIGVRTLIDELRLYNRALTPPEVANACLRYRPGDEASPLPFAHARMAMNFPLRSFEADVELLDEDRDRVASVAWQVYPPTGGDPIVDTVMEPIRDGRGTLSLEDVSVGWGRYRAELSFRDAEGGLVAEQTVEQEREQPPWFGFRGGVHEGEVLPGWDPITLADGALHLQLRSIAFNAEGWPERLVSRGENLLAAPVRLLAEQAGAPVAWQPAAAEVAVEHAADDKVVTVGGARGGGLTVSTRITTEFDGMMKVESTLAPAEGEASLDALRLEIPLREEDAEFLGFWTGLRNFRYGTRYRRLPAGEGVVWHSVEPGRPRAKTRQGSFVPYVHLAGDDRGLAWFAENDWHWTIADDPPAVQILRRDGQAVLQLNLLSTRTTIDEARTYVFGLHLTPVRELPEDFRSHTAPLRFGHVDSFSKQDLKSDGNWGNFNIYPAEYDWKGARIRAEIHNEQYKQMHGYGGVVYYIDRNWVGLPPSAREFSPVWYGSGFFRYLEEAQNCYLWHMNEWLRRDDLIRGFYIDDAWIGKFTHERSGLAYKLPDGSVQPGYEFFDYHDFMKRLRWLFHENDREPYIWVHMTQTYYVPCLSFATVVLDGEWKFLTWGAKNSFLKAWGFPRLRHNNGRKFGIPPVWMNKIGANDKAAVGMPHWEYRQMRAYLAGVKLHDLNPVGQRQYDFESAGCTGDEARFVGYWDPAVPATPLSEETYASAYLQEGRAALVVVNGSYTDERVLELRLHPERFDLGAADPADLVLEDHDTYAPPAGEDITKIEAPEGPRADPGELGADDEGFGDLAAEFEEELAEEAAAEAREGEEPTFEYTDHNFRYQDGVLKLRVRAHDYRLLLVKPKQP